MISIELKFISRFQNYRQHFFRHVRSVWPELANRQCNILQYPNRLTFLGWHERIISPLPIYEIRMVVFFSNHLLSLVDQSFVFPIAFMHFHAPKKVWVVTLDKKLFHTRNFSHSHFPLSSLSTMSQPSAQQ